MARPSVGGFGRSEGVGAEPQQLQQWLLSLVLGHASATLSDAADGGSGSPVPAGAATAAAEDAVPQAVATAAEACVCVCLLLSRTDVLFGRVFQLFAQQGVVPSALGALVETVELAVLSDLLQGLAPEVMQVCRGWGRGRGPAWLMWGCPSVRVQHTAIAACLRCLMQRLTPQKHLVVAVCYPCLSWDCVLPAGAGGAL